MGRCSPARGRQWRELWDKYIKPTLDQALADGTILGYGVDVEYVHTGPADGRYSWILASNAEALDKVETAFGTVLPKAAAAFADVTVPGTHRDSLERVLDYAHK
jgi:hypothetical protein